MNTLKNPLLETPPAEIPLPNAPLIRVIAQIRFPIIASIEKQDFIASFQEAIRSDYPVLRMEKNTALNSDESVSIKTIWRFQDNDGFWRISLAPTFLSLETTRYANREDFFMRFEKVLSALQENINPGAIDRLGIRYIDRVESVNLEEMSKLVRPEIAGILDSSLKESIHFSISENVFKIGDTQVMARWGWIPASVTVDPSAIRPTLTPSWILDIDASEQKELYSFDIKNIILQGRKFAEVIYSVFRWAITDEFIRRYGGKP